MSGGGGGGCWDTPHTFVFTAQHERGPPTHTITLATRPPPSGWVERLGLRGAPWTDEVMAQWLEAVILQLGETGGMGSGAANGVPHDGIAAPLPTR